MASIAEDYAVAESDERLGRLEEKMTWIASDISDLKTSNHSIAESLKLLSVLEERHRTSDEAMKRMFGRIEANEGRIGTLELQMPNIALASSWVFKVVLAIVSLSGITYIVSILRGVALR